MITVDRLLGIANLSASGELVKSMQFPHVDARCVTLSGRLHGSGNCSENCVSPGRATSFTRRGNMTRKVLGLVVVAALVAMVADSADARRCGGRRRGGCCQQSCCGPSCAAPSCCAPACAAPSCCAPTCCDVGRRGGRRGCCGNNFGGGCCGNNGCCGAAPSCCAPSCCAPTGCTGGCNSCVPGGDYSPAPVENAPEPPAA